MKSKVRQAADLEAELLRLTSLVRQRRKQLQRLAKCPNKDCECRRVWREVVQQTLSGQVSKIRNSVKARAKKKPAAKARLTKV
jgi:hypothetical protein